MPAFSSAAWQAARFSLASLALPAALVPAAADSPCGKIFALKIENHGNQRLTETLRVGRSQPLPAADGCLAVNFLDIYKGLASALNPASHLASPRRAYGSRFTFTAFSYSTQRLCWTSLWMGRCKSLSLCKCTTGGLMQAIACNTLITCRRLRMVRCPPTCAGLHSSSYIPYTACRAACRVPKP